MQRKTVYKANEILKRIKEHEKSLEQLEYLSESGTKTLIFETCNGRIVFEPWEICQIIQNKKQQIAALERELEEL